MIATQRIYKSPHKILLTGFVCVLCAFLLVGSVSAAGIDTTALGWNPKLADYMTYKLSFTQQYDDNGNLIKDEKCLWGDGEMSDFETEWDNYMIAYTATADPVTRGGMKTMGAPDLSATPIYDGGSLQNMSPTGNYYLANDINCVGMTWTPIGSASTPFIGVLDGQGHSIKNLVITSATANASKYGLFSVCGSGAQIKNLVMDNCAVTGTHTDGGILIGTLVMSTSVHNTSVIADVVFQDCDMNVSVASGDLRAAFGIGYSTTSADVEFRHVSIVRSDLLSASGNNVGGLVGYVYTNSTVRFVDCKMDDCVISASGNSVGGLVGNVYTNSTVLVDSDCKLTQCKIYTASGNNVGGLVGYVYTNSTATINGNGNILVERCQVSSASGNYVGGLVGYVNTNSTANIDSVRVSESVISASGNYVGGLVGNVNTNSTANVVSGGLENCVVTGTDYIGGIIGRIQVTSIGNVDTCNVIRCTIVGTGNTGYIGGIIGQVSGSTYTIKTSTISASCLKGKTYVGGLLGGITA